MNIRRRTLLYSTILISFLLLRASSLSAAIDVSGTITGDTTWTSADIIHLIGIVTVTGHLTILPGTVIQGDQSTGIHVQGSFTAIGEYNNRVLFTCRADTVGGTPIAGGWSGFWCDENSIAVMRHCRMRYADRAISLYAASLEFDSCVVENFLDRGIYIDGGPDEPYIQPIISNSIFRQTDAVLQGTGKGIYTTRLADVTIERCQVTQCDIGMTFETIGKLKSRYQVRECEVSQNNFIGIYSYASG